MSVVALARVLRESLQETLASVESGILGGVSTWDEYRGLVGKRQGIMQALATLDEEVRRFDEQD